MTKEIELRVDPEIESKIQITPYGVEFLSKPTIEEWHKAVLGVQKVHGMTQFYLGDLMVFAESPITGWGESKYEDLMDTTGYDYQTLRQYASVARRFSSEFRERVYSNIQNSPLTFSHFQLVASLDDARAQHFLEMVRDSKWTVAKLRDEVLKFKNGGVLPEKAEKDVVQWRADVKDSLKRIYDSQPETIIIRSMKDGRVVAEEVIEIPQN